MIIAIWIVSGLLALLSLVVGVMKVITAKDKFSEQMAWTEDFSPVQIKLIGAAEVLAAVGLILPPLTGILPILAPIAAVGLVILQLGAIVVHIRRGETKGLGMNILIVVLALFVALARFGVFGAF